MSKKQNQTVFSILTFSVYAVLCLGALMSIYFIFFSSIN